MSSFITNIVLLRQLVLVVKPAHYLCQRKDLAARTWRHAQDDDDDEKSEIFTNTKKVKLLLCTTIAINSMDNG